MNYRILLGLMGALSIDAGSACADQHHKEPIEGRMRGAGHQIEVYIGHEPNSALLDQLEALPGRNLSVSILVSPDVPDGSGLVKKLNVLFEVDQGDPPTICVLQASFGSTHIVVIDHLQYRSDFEPDGAFALTRQPGGSWEQISFPDSQSLAEQTEALSGTCQL